MSHGHNFTRHAKKRAYERCSKIDAAKSLEDDYEWVKVRYKNRLDNYDPDKIYYYCEELELLAPGRGKTAHTAIPKDSSLFKKENGKFNRVKDDDNKSETDVSLKDEVKEDFEERRWESQGL